MIKKRLQQSLALGFLLVFIAVEYFGLGSLLTINPYAMYGFEIVFLGVVAALYRNWHLKHVNMGIGSAAIFFFSIASGFAAYEFISVLGYSQPFSLRDPEVVIFLLLVGPILEEAIFRGAVWRLIEEWTHSQVVLFLVSAGLFAYSHYHVIDTAPGELHGFIQYQTLYTFALGLLCSGVRHHVGLWGAMLVHLTFNFGFWLGSF